MEKGEYLQECNRTVCKNTPAVFFNYSTKMFYCASCARLINDANRKDAIQMFGHDLCLKVDLQKEYEKIQSFNNKELEKLADKYNLSVDSLLNHIAI